MRAPKSDVDPHDGTPSCLLLKVLIEMVPRRGNAGRCFLSAFVGDTDGLVAG
jgi:hypothetical protein